MRVAQCSTKTLCQLLQENYDKVANACSRVTDHDINSCSCVADLLSKNSYMDSAATLAEIGVVLSIALLTEFVPKPIPSMKELKVDDETGFWSFLGMALRTARSLFARWVSKNGVKFGLAGLLFSICSLGIMVLISSPSKLIVVGFAYLGVLIPFLAILVRALS